ncbi:Gfo/Idh/MocA family oxidoreductase [Devosia ginsengisoli]|uniref:Gfo/Idh/MocA family oxidoreductase n=1 Tax=Devosia ginsengisoli TaxID=400770 RepID=A0A5B8M049_9HYPH|nr:Gfo/Idh/MocA family oxidoreductase [Devosia ginsengisoli]
MAIVGAGNMAREHIKAFSALPGVRVAGIQSRTRSRAEVLAAEFGIATVSDDIDALWQATRADLVVVTVPELALNAVAKAVFARDWAVLLEKPAGYNLADAQDIAAAASGHAKPVMVGFNRRFYSSTRAALADLDASAERRFIHIQDQQSFAEARRYNHPEQVVENFMYANSIHVIDMIRTFSRGEIASVTPIMPWHGEETEVVLAHIAFDSGDAALYQGVWRGPGPWTCSVSTPSRRWNLQPLEVASYQNAGERRLNALEMSEDDRAFKPGFKLQAEAVLKSMAGDRQAAPDIADSMKTMELISRIFQRRD